MRLIARFAKEINNQIEIIDIFDKEVKRVIAKNFQIESLTKKYPLAIWMERKISDEFGVKFINSFDTRPLIKHERFPKKNISIKKRFYSK